MGYSVEGQERITITNTFQKNLDESGRTPNKISVYQGSEFYNRSMNSWLYNNGIEMYSTHNKGKSAVAELFIRTLKTKTHKHMTVVPKKLYIDKLYEIVPNWSEEVFVIKNVKNTVPCIYVIEDLKGDEVVGTFYKKEQQKTNQSLGSRRY